MKKCANLAFLDVFVFIICIRYKLIVGLKYVSSKASFVQYFSKVKSLAFSPEPKILKKKMKLAKYGHVPCLFIVH